MTTAQRNAIANPVPGMMIYNITTQKLEVFSSGWGAMNFTSPSLKGLHGGSNLETAFSVQQTTDGGYIVVGPSGSSNSGSITGLFNNGPDDLLVIRLDAVLIKLLTTALYLQAELIHQTQELSPG